MRLKISHILFLAFPAAIVMRVMGAPHVLIFITSCIGILPMAGLMGHATESLAKHFGSSVGGLLNATFGNATELIIAGFALHAGLFDLVKASLIGSIIGNLLLVFGLSILLGGWRRTVQKFNRHTAGVNASMMIIAVGSLMIPAIFSHAHGGMNGRQIEYLSLTVGGILIATYLLGLWFSFKTHKALFAMGDEHEEPVWTKARAFTWLVASTVGVAILSEILVKSVEVASHSLGLTEMFVGLIVVPIIGNAAEHGAAVVLAMKDKMDISVNIALGSSTQIALFVAPVLVILGWAIGREMSFVFEVSELVAVALSVAIANLIVSDGETHWFEGVGLLAMYGMLAVGFYYVP